MVRFQALMTQKYNANQYEDFKIIYAFHPTPFGECLIGVTNTDKAVVHLAFVDKSNEEALAELTSNWPLSDIIKDTSNETKAIVNRIFTERKSMDDSISILPKGTEFQLQVWEALMRIPEGNTTTYEQVALDIGRSNKVARAVGNAVMKNNIAILIPCHRVMAKSGTNKYKWGAKRKESILMHERKHTNA